MGSRCNVGEGAFIETGVTVGDDVTIKNGVAVYAGVTENSIYIAEAARGQGVGRQLLQALVEGAERDGIWTIQTGIFPENRASIALHERCGYRTVGLRERLGRLHGVWRDVVLMERRSAVAG